MDSILLNKTATSFAEKMAIIPEHTIVAGFDAMVDQMVTVVGERTSPQSYEALSTIGDFGVWASACAGKSGLREAVLSEEVAGGCSQNMGDGIATFGFQLHAYASFGEPYHSAFEGYINKCYRATSIMEPGTVTCYEFDDGKLMLAFLSHFAEITPAYLDQHLLTGGSYFQSCQAASAIVLTSWSLFPFMTDCWKHLQEQVLSKLSHRPHIYSDLADPSSRSADDILEMLDTLKGFEVAGRTSLSLNGNEANQLARILTIEEADGSFESLNRLAAELRDYCQISEVGIHLVKSATAATAEAAETVVGPYCAQPKKSVGAGDRFNAGYLTGLLLDLPLAERLQLGTLSSGFFVRNARSASAAELLQFMKE